MPDLLAADLSPFWPTHLDFDTGQKVPLGTETLVIGKPLDVK